MAPLTDRVFIVTGAGGALAGPIVRALAHAGARLVLVDRHDDHVRERAREHHATALAADLSTLEGATAMVNAVVGRHGRVDGLVHTVGGFAMGRIVDGDAATYDRMFDLNVRTLFNVLRAVAPGMLARGDGFICGISSEPGWTGRSPGTALYGAAKAAATSLLRTLEVEARGTQVGVCIVYPMGAIDTPANRKDMPNADPASFIDPNEIAASILHAATRGARGRLSELPIHPPRPT
ncbi:MAG TPA: SDR family NAD(P)-dependent oxidoreductase [Polyangia bacterium]